MLRRMHTALPTPGKEEIALLPQFDRLGLDRLCRRRGFRRRRGIGRRGCLGSRCLRRRCFGSRCLGRGCFGCGRGYRDGLHRLGWRRFRLGALSKSGQRPWAYKKPEHWGRASALQRDEFEEPCFDD